MANYINIHGANGTPPASSPDTPRCKLCRKFLNDPIDKKKSRSGWFVNCEACRAKKRDVERKKRARDQAQVKEEYQVKNSRVEECEDVGEASAKSTNAEDEDDSEEENDELSHAGSAKRWKTESASNYEQSYNFTDHGLSYKPNDYGRPYKSTDYGQPYQPTNYGSSGEYGSTRATHPYTFSTTSPFVKENAYYRSPEQIRANEISRPVMRLQSDYSHFSHSTRLPHQRTPVLRTARRSNLRLPCMTIIILQQRGSLQQASSLRLR